jgi:hypothetical protein
MIDVSLRQLTEVNYGQFTQAVYIGFGRCGRRSHGDGFELNRGDPWEQPPEMTIREFAREYYGCVEEYIERHCDPDDDEYELDLDGPADEFILAETWYYRDSPSARAYRLLEDLDLGSTLEGQDAVGGLRFIDGLHPGNDYFGVLADDEISISLLQKRLNDLNTGIHITMA